MAEQWSGQSSDRLDVAIQRVLAEIYAGLRHGYFEYTLVCEVIGRGQRRLLLRAGKHYQFVIPADACNSAARPGDPCNRGAGESSP
jgi:hypothetical protein